MHDYVIIGGGIVGLATAMAVGNKYSGASILVLEKEQDLAQHQSGRNSGVIHSGIYYKPGSLKARFAREGNRSMVEFCREHGIKHEVCGKVIVATKPSELPLLDSLFQRGLDHRLAVARLGPEQVREIEPHVRCLAGIKVPSTGIVNYREVSAITESLRPDLLLIAPACLAIAWPALVASIRVQKSSRSVVSTTSWYPKNGIS